MSETNTVPEISSSNTHHGENYHRGMGRRATDRLVKWGEQRILTAGGI